MGVEGDNAALRIMLRQFAPNITEAFENVARITGEGKYHWRLMIGYDHRDDYDNVANNRMIMKSSLSKQTVRLENKPEELDTENKNILNDIFPVAAQLIQETALDWNIEPFGVLLVLRLIYAGPDKKETMELKMQEKGKDGDPNRREVIVA